MKKLQVMIEDELMETLKIFAVRQGKSLKDIVTEAVEVHMEDSEKPEPKQNSKPKPKPTPKPVLIPKKEKTKKEKKKPEPVLVPDEEEPLPDKPFYTLRKPVFEGKPETRPTRKTNLMVEWWLEEGDSQYFDEHQSIIPFRYKKADGTDYTPNAAEIKLLEEAYEKPVKIEETKKSEIDEPEWKAF